MRDRDFDPDDIEAHIERWGRLYYAGKVSAELLDRVANEIAVLWRHRAKRWLVTKD